jgi:hypothetical protein
VFSITQSLSANKPKRYSYCPRTISVVRAMLIDRRINKHRELTLQLARTGGGTLYFRVKIYSCRNLDVAKLLKLARPAQLSATPCEQQNQYPHLLYNPWQIVLRCSMELSKRACVC